MNTMLSIFSGIAGIVRNICLVKNKNEQQKHSKNPAEVGRKCCMLNKNSYNMAMFIWIAQ